VSTSLILFLTGVACGVLFAGAAVYHQTANEGRPFRAVRWAVPGAAFAFCVAFGGLAFLLDSGVAGKTLYETEVTGSGASTPVVLTFDVPVEHPGAVHELLVDPRDDGVDVHDPVDVAVRVADPSGQVLVDERETLDPRCEGGTVDRCTWDSWSKDITPATAGSYALTVTVLTPDVPVVHVWVGDDEKTDGHRIAGY
jgi:hypothetical protein